MFMPSRVGLGEKFAIALARSSLGAVLLAAVALAFACACPAFAGTLARDCPNPLVIQTDWLAGAEQGALYQLIGDGGTIGAGRYEGAMGDTGLHLILLQGGAGLWLGHGETAYSALYTGNSRARLKPDLAQVDTDNAITFSQRFPVVQVLALLERSPAGLFWDPATYPHGFASVDDLIAFGQSKRGKIYLSTVNRTFGKFLLDRGVPRETFVEGYRGDLDTFLVHSGAWLNQGFATNEVLKLKQTAPWRKPLGFVSIGALGYDMYASALAVRADRLTALSACLSVFIPRVQQAMVDYAREPEAVALLLERINTSKQALGFWRTPGALNRDAIAAARREGYMGNGPNAIAGDFDLARVRTLLGVLGPGLDDRAKRAVKAEDIVTNRFIDPAVSFPQSDQQP